MSGIGLPELVVVALVVAVLFGAPILTFFMGYVVGKNRAATTPTEPGEAAPAPASTPETPGAPAPEDQPATPEEPADE